MGSEEPLDPPAARQLVRRILNHGTTAASRHALEEMEKDGLIMVDVVNVLRGGVYEPGELERGSWRYPVRTRTMAAVVAFRSQTEIRIVTAWRLKP